VTKSSSRPCPASVGALKIESAEGTGASGVSGNVGAIAGIIGGIVGGLALVAAMVLFCKKKAKATNTKKLVIVVDAEQAKEADVKDVMVAVNDEAEVETAADS
jgi:hypothetical protein